MTDIHIVRDYPHPPAKVWRAVTDPNLIPLWTATGQGARPVGVMLTAGLPAVLDDLDDNGVLRSAGA